MKTRAHSLTGRYLTLSSGETLSKLFVLIALAWTARVLGPSQYGLIEFSLALMVMFGLVAESGLGSYGARVVASATEPPGRLVAQIVLIRGVLAIAAYLVILGLSSRYGKPGIGALAVFGLTVLLVPFLTQWVFQGMGRMHWVAAGTVLRNLVFATIVLAWVRPGTDLRRVAVAEVCGVAALALFNAVILRRVIGVRLNWHGAAHGGARVFREAWPLGASDLTWVALWYAPSLALGVVGDAQGVAWLAGPLRIVLALHTFVWLYFFNLLPNLSKAARDGVGVWRQLATRSLGTSLWAAGLIGLAGTLLARDIVTTVYGQAYEPATIPLMVVIWMIPIAWLSGHFRYSLIATGNQRAEFGAAVVTTVTSGVLAVLLALMAGSTGAAAALVAGGLLNAVLTASAVKRRVGQLAIGRSLARPLAACIACGLLGTFIGEVAGGLTGAAAALVVYGAIAVMQDAELTRLRHAWLQQ